ncbi:MAG: MFS transporter [Bacteroidales bacterium]|jgi:MFS family permease
MGNREKERALIYDANLHLIFVVTLLAVMGVASLAPAFPRVIEFFQITKKQVGLLITVFTLPGIFLAPFAGILADRLGRKNILIPSMILFGIAGFLCMFTRSFETLLVLRFFQGMGASSLSSLNITLIGDMYSGSRRITAMGYNASVLSIGTAAYPAIGGSLAMAGWNFPFILPLLAVPLAILILVKLKNPEPKSRSYFLDYLRNTWKKINQRTVWGLLILNVLVFFLIYGALITYLPLLLKDRFGANSLVIGLTISLTSFTTAFTSSQLGKISRLFSSRTILLMSIGLYGISMIAITFSGHLYLLILPLLFFGLAQGLFIPTVQTLLVGFAPIEERAVFMSVNSMVLRTGQTIAPLFMGLLYGWGGFTVTFLGGAGIAFIMAITVMFLVKKMPA